MPPRLRIASLAMLVAGLGANSLLAAAEQAGVAAAVRGQVQIAERTGAIGKQVQSGEQVFLGNAITSGPNSGMQIILLDQTTFTIGPNSQIVVDEFVYDPKTNAGKMTATITKGVFRFVTGKMSREQPGAMQVKLPTGTIGIRGTSGLGQTGNGGPQQMILLGPGNDTETNNKGGLDLILGELVVSLIRSGWGSTLTGDGRWGPAERADPALIAQLLTTLRGAWQTRDAGQQGPSGDANQNAGNSVFDGRSLASLAGDLNATTLYAQWIQDEASRFGRDRLTGMPDGSTTYDMLRTINTGNFQWTQNNVPLNPLSNTYNLVLQIDFGRRTIGGSGSSLTVSTGTLTGGFISLPGVAYSALAGNASYSLLDTSIIDSPGCGGNCRLRFLGLLFNRSGVTANDLTHSVTIRNAADTIVVGSGGGTVVGRTPVP